MKRIVLKLIAIIAVVAIIFQFNVVLAASTSDLQKQQSDNQKQINNAQENLKGVQQEKTQTSNEINSIEDQISTYESEIDQLDSKMVSLNQDIATTEDNIEQAEQEYNEKSNLLAERLVVMYEDGNTSYIDFLLSSDGLTDFLSKFYMVSELASYDNDLLNQIQDKKKEIETEKAKLETSKTELASSRTQKESTQKQLEVVKSQKSEQVVQLTGQEKEIQDELNELQQANVQIGQEIQAAQQKYAAQIAALNKAASEKNKANNNKTSTGGNNNSGKANTGKTDNNSSGTYSGGGSGILARPVSSSHITAGMYYPSGAYHGAIDYGVPAGTPVYAAADGVVLKTANLTSSYGTYVVIQHANGLQTWYAHGTPGSIRVSEGQTVSRGQQIMNSGNSGHSTGAHLHFEVRVAPYSYSSCRVNPANYM